VNWLNKLPISIRLSISYAMWSSSLIIIVSCGCYKTIELLLYRSLDAALISVARSINDASFSGSDVKSTPSKAIIDYNNPKLKTKRSTNYHSIRPFAQIINVSGEVYSKTKNMRVRLPVTPNALKRANDSLLTYETFTFKNKSPLRQISFPVIKQSRFDGNLIQVGTSLGSIIYILRSIRLVLWFFAPFMCIMSIVLGYFITSRALTPVRKITDSARRISIEDLGVRFKLPEASDEIRDLSLAFNTMFDRLELSVNKLKRFIGDVSHELRTPLSVISIESQLALRRQRTVSEYKTTINTVQNETKHMTQIVEDLLLLTKAENNCLNIKKEKVNIENFIYSIFESIKVLCNSKKVSIDINFSGVVGDMSCSPGYLAIALKNILLNAVKHSRGNTEVILNIFRKGKAIVFVIKDFGEGISKKDLPHIFQYFYREDTARNRDSGGVGIGLSLAVAFVKMHRGNISVISEKGKGASFTVEIPCV
jgi:signal transduction histidine kinase